MPGCLSRQLNFDNPSVESVDSSKKDGYVVCNRKPKHFLKRRTACDDVVVHVLRVGFDIRNRQILVRDVRFPVLAFDAKCVTWLPADVKGYPSKHSAPSRYRFRCVPHTHGGMLVHT